jgi:serine/threonine protein kinase
MISAIGSHTSADTYLSPGNTGFANTSTLATANAILAMPGYLQVEHNVDFVLKKQIAMGGMGSVWIADMINGSLRERCQDATTCIVKMSHIVVGKDMFTMFQQEVSLMSLFSGHRNIASVIGFSLAPQCLLMKYYALGSLEQFVKRGQPLTSYTVHNLIYGIANGLRAMHVRYVAHCDIKPANVLLEETMIYPNRRILRAVLTDFGIAKILDSRLLAVKSFTIQNLNGASIRYAGPEVLLAFHGTGGQALSPREILAGDVFSWATTVYEVINRRIPWS